MAASNLREKIYSAKRSVKQYHKKSVISRFEKRLRRRLKNESFSIICSNCIGGIIYHRLNKEFLSPTINLWFYQNEFIKFISDIHTYLNYDLEFVQGIRDYPVAFLGDIRIFFLHYNSESEAREAWERRKARINFDNLYIILIDTDGITEEDIKGLKKISCRNIVILSNKERKGLEYIQPIRCDGRFTDKDKNGLRVFEKQWDYVKWLNSDKD